MRGNKLRKSGNLDVLLVELTGELYKSGDLRGQTTPTGHQLAYLAQASRQEGINADYLEIRPLFDISSVYKDPKNLSFPQSMTDEQVITIIEEANSGIIAFGMMYYQIPDSVRIAGKLKARNPSITILGGGYGPSAYPELLLDNPGIFDYLLIGNAFRTLPWLVSHLNENKSIGRKTVKLEHRLSTQDANKFKALSTQVASSAFATLGKNKELLLLERASEDDQFDASQLGPVFQKPEYAGVSGFVFPIPIPNQRSYNIMASFGCGFNCTYCSTPMMFGTGKKGNFSSRFRNPKKVVKEIGMLSRQNGANTFFFTDPNFNFDGNFVYSISNELIEARNNRQIPKEAYFYAMLTPYDKQQRALRGFPLSKEEAKQFFSEGKWGAQDYTALELMKKAGFGRVAFGAESFSENNLKSYRRLNTINDLQEYNDQAHKNGICSRNFYFISSQDDIEALSHGAGIIKESLPHEIRIAYYVPTFESPDGRQFFAEHLGKRLASGFSVDPKGIYALFRASDAAQNIAGIKRSIPNEELEGIRRKIARDYYSSGEYKHRVDNLISGYPEYEKSIRYFESYLKIKGLM